jgi:hypothetical protein
LKLAGMWRSLSGFGDLDVHWEKNMEFKENLDLVVDYTKKFIDTVTPVAKQAYEIGLMTLQIDAAQSLILGAISVAFLVFFIRKMNGKYKSEDDLFDDPMAPFYVVGGGILGVASIVGAFTTILNVWVWVKLIRPELWLAHQAIEKLLK